MRLTRSEVDEFGEKGYIEEKTQFGNSTLTYALKSLEGEPMSVVFVENTIIMYVSESFREEWANTERIGIEGYMPLDNGERLYMLLEKDFKCLDQTNEDQDDNYDNPLIAKL